MRENDIDAAEEMLELRRREIYANRLVAIGFECRTRYNNSAFPYILVYSPVSDIPNAWATVTEAKRLLDTVRNLPKDEAYRRWYAKIDTEIESLPYTEDMARRDTREYRNELKYQLFERKIDSKEYCELYGINLLDLAR